ncbi:MAG: HU family DNA-binding protein [Candidatus Latescibacterota bacterium]
MAKTVKKDSAVKEAMTKTQILNELAQNTGLARKDVAAVMAELTSLIERHVKKRGVGTFTLPGLLRIKTVKRPARKAQKGVPNPFRPGETMDVKARPASTVVKVQPLKKLKDMVQ